MSELFEYKALAGFDWIRIIELEPGTEPAALVCHVHHVHLETHPAYEALSYEWRCPVKSHRITMSDGGFILITESLYNALTDLRHPRKARRIWADGVCINQSDTIERQLQVSMMGEIYSQAERVITYTGPRGADGHLAVGLAKEIMTCYHAFCGLDNLVPQSTNCFQSIANISPDHPSCTALKAFILRGWSGRSWCAQEFLLNQELIVMCGRHVLKWDMLSTIVLLSYRQLIPPIFVPNAAEDPYDTRECLVKLAEMRTEVLHSQRKLPLADLLILLHPFRATDPRDKIYAMFGLCQDNMGIVVDYGCSVESLYTSVATKLLAQLPDLNLLHHNLGQKSPTLALPSWVPDWSTWRAGSRGLAWDGQYLACGRTTCNFEIQSDARLAVEGSLVDYISEVGEPIGLYYRYLRAPGHGSWLQQQEKLVEKAISRPADSEPWAALARSLIATDEWIANKRGSGGDIQKAYVAHRCAASGNTPDDEAVALRFVNAVRRRSRYRRLCLSRNGFFGAVPEEAQVGDWISIIHGMKLLFVIRPVELGYRLVGHAYIDGLMMGEALDLEVYKKSMLTLT